MSTAEVLVPAELTDETARRRTVFERPLADLKGTFINVATQAAACHLRFVDCVSFLEDSILRIHEYLGPPLEHYSAVSYVWKGLGMLKESAEGAFEVVGAESADPISIDVLRTACVASIAFQSRLLWLDRLCILQGNPTDKRWQIRNMFDIYRNAHPCLVLPGGLSRLATLFDRISWIHRSWTLQESVAPSTKMCIFAWSLGSATSFAYSLGEIQELERGRSAMAHLVDLLNFSLITTGTLLRLHEFPRDISEMKLGCFVNRIEVDDWDCANSIRIFTCIFGHASSLSEKMHLAVLVQALSYDGDTRPNAIWRSSYLRTSSRAVDAVLSIMGLFGVQLDPSNYTEHDRLRATIDLMQSTLVKGERANWLAVSLDSKLSSELSLIPKFPVTRVDGEAFYVTTQGDHVAVTKNFGFSWWWPRNLPRGSMDNEGYFTFRAPALPLPGGELSSSIRGPRYSALLQCYTSKTELYNNEKLFGNLNNNDELVDDLYNGISKPHGHDDNSANLYAIWIGTKKAYHAVAMNVIPLDGPIFMLAQRPTKSDRFFCVGFTSMGDEFVLKQRFIEREFTVGGSGPATADDSDACSFTSSSR